ncbi:ABC transporter substrate-binding protein [Pelagibacterium lacus]|uniref:Sugar ABC transporter substrate-binding protein n=1 Tax=Pelagibacterium lacus TaxID=2282655 RepID=A0A369W2P7_9HYPH|nr:sugar ABC transporter substrate-binding protein [Pelagibacterium lacus]RDE08946.1 sugar ABC transporter substrate-binding protein [Pelagibacterium lacus]
MAALTLAPLPAVQAQDIDFMVVDYDAPGMGDWWKLLVEKYNAESGATVIPRSVSAGSYYEQLLIQAASGAGPDVLTVNPNNLGELLAAGHILPLDDYIDAANLRDAIVPGGWDSLTVDGTTYALPITGRTLELIYNACHFEEAGIASPPTTPEEFLAYAEQLTVSDESGRVSRYGANMVNANEDPTFEMLLMWTLAFGGAFSDDAGNFTLDSQPVIDALTFMKTVYDSGATPQGMSETDLRALFATGGSAMTIDGQWQFPFIEQNNAENFDCYRTAKHPWDGPATGGVNMALAINATSDNPEAAWEFLAMAASPDLQSQFSDHSPYLPYGVGALTDEQLAARPYLAPYVESSGTAHPIAIPGHADQFNEIWPVVVDAVLLTLRDGVPAEQSLAEAQQRLEDCCS